MDRKDVVIVVLAVLCLAIILFALLARGVDMAYDSGWIDITDKGGQYFNVTHNLNSMDVMVDITGKTTPDGGVHQRNIGGTWYTTGWDRTFGGTADDDGFSVVQATDGGYAIAGGKSYEFGGSFDFWLVKTDGSGNTQWNKTYGGSNSEFAYAVVQTGDEGYALAGYTMSYGAGENDFWLVKTNSNGIAQWSRTYGGTDRDHALSVVQTGDEGYALTGITDSFGAGDSDFWFVKTDASGNAQWSKTYGGTSGEFAYAVVQTGDEGYALAGDTASYGAGGSDFWLVKTDAAGNAQWKKTYGGTGVDDAYSVIQTADGGYALCGITGSYGAGGYDFWMVKTDSNGNAQWNKTYGGTDWDYAHSVVQTVDGGYAIAGLTSSYGAGLEDFWLVKTEAESGLAWTGSTANTITLYRGAFDPYWNFVRVRIWDSP